MPNSIKYTTSTEGLALKKGNFAIGTGDVGKGPSETTGYYNGVEPQVGGWVVYLNRPGAPGNLEYRSLSNSAQLINYTNQISGQNFTTAEQCLSYYATQTDKIIINRDYEPIITNGLVLNLDAGFTPSYPNTGTTFYDLIGSNNGTLVNGPTFNNNSLSFDGSNDYITFNTTTGWGNNSLTLTAVVYPEFDSSQYGRPIITKWNDCNSGEFALDYGRISNKFGFLSQQPAIFSADHPKNNWYIVTVTYDATPGLVSMWVNGNLQTSVIQQFTINGLFNGPFNIGRFNGCYPAVVPFHGKVSIVNVYNRALSSAEVLQNFNKQRARFGL